MAATSPIDQVLLIEPNEYLRFVGPFTDVVKAEITVKNPTDELIAYKVKTTAPKRYAVKPNSGTIEAGETIVIQISRQPFEFDAGEKLKHKFMVQSVKLPPGADVNKIWQDVDPKFIMDTRLRVVFDDQPASNRSSFSDEDYFNIRDENTRLSKENDELKKESSRLRSLVASNSLEQESSKGLALLFKEKKNIFVILLLLLVVFVMGIMAADTVILMLEQNTGSKKV